MWPFRDTSEDDAGYVAVKIMVADVPLDKILDLILL
jgi:hypothetical protein